ncbi:MAG: sensor histidine kinase [Acetobacteraceae bacterium]
MRLNRLLRTSSFRLTLLYAGLFGVSVVVLFAVMFWAASRYADRQIDSTVSDEISEVQRAAAGHGLAGLRAVVAPLTAQAAPGVYYLLEDSAGRVLAGNLPAMPRVLGISELHPGRGRSGIASASGGIRGRGVRTGDGGYLFVGVGDLRFAGLTDVVTDSFAWVLVIGIALALLGGAVMSLGLLRRVEVISQASRDIVAGDLGRRIAVRGTNDEFDHLAVSLNAMLDRIAELMEGLRQVSSDIAHDLRTPLTRLRQRMELAHRRGGPAAALSAALDASIRDVDVILDTFGALLRIAQIEAGNRTAEFAPVDLSELLADIADAYLPVAEERGQFLCARIADGLRVEADRELLTQMFANLVENAIRHCPEGATIRLAADADARGIEARGIEASVADDGPGIPPELHEKVFQRFFRLDRSRGTPGTGLGLSLVAAVAALHGTELTLADNQPGLVVSVRIPRASG